MIFYSLYGGTAELAAAIAEGARQGGAAVRLRRVAELAPTDRWSEQERIRAAREHLASVPLAQRDDLVWADGIALGSPARYGAMSAQLGRFLDDARRLSGDLAGKVACVFCSPSPAPGAQRAALHSMIAPLLAHGALIQAPARAETERMDSAARPDSQPPPEPGRGPLGLDLPRARALGRRLALSAQRTRG
ncbi:flavodoxin family protein [Sorangium cellulosum]|uniref:flavodoxin family protein n=1 Tax=Sorangium cellulosum TaxID=56 RepID=UPI001F43973A|nr:NAD(P)H-dependent oxidoreductase [Sorangium cellulosum]